MNILFLTICDVRAIGFTGSNPLGPDKPDSVPIVFFFVLRVDLVSYLLLHAGLFSPIDIVQFRPEAGPL